jgi:hypothetical protein
MIGQITDTGTQAMRFQPLYAFPRVSGYLSQPAKG